MLAQPALAPAEAVTSLQRQRMCHREVSIEVDFHRAAFGNADLLAILTSFGHRRYCNDTVWPRNTVVLTLQGRLLK